MYNEKKTIIMTNQVNVIQLNDSPILFLSEDGSLRFGYTKLVPSTTSRKGYLQISKQNEAHLIEIVNILDKQYRGVTIDNIFWFIVEDLIELNANSKERSRAIEKLLSDISKEHKGFIQCVDNIGTREYVLMVSSQGLRDKLFIH